MPRKEPLNEKILRALQSRQHKCEQLNQREKFAYEKAIAAVRGVNKNITNPATQLKKCVPASSTEPRYPACAPAHGLARPIASTVTDTRHAVCCVLLCCVLSWCWLLFWGLIATDITCMYVCCCCSVKGITGRIFDTIIKVCSGLEPEEAPPPTPSQLRQAADRVPERWQNPPAKGTGGWAILIVLYRVRVRWQTSITSSVPVRLQESCAGLNTCRTPAGDCL